MASWKSLCLVMLLLAGCSQSQGEHIAANQPPSPAPTENHPYSGFWADDGHFDEGFGLVIAPAGAGMYSVSFCGPGGCFEPGTYRPNTPIVGDSGYQLTDPDTIGVSVSGGGYQRYERCRVAPNNSFKPNPLRGSA